ncbi:MAG TPA: DNA primase [Myxococcaceae bacterium]|nr:DNA primase [Myxococcaceae bacterium]
MAIPEHKLAELQRRVDMLALVGQYVKLEKAGREWKGRCPFHNERSPSFYVNAEKGVFRCYGCEAGGNAFTFLQRILGKSFLDTVRDLARELGVDLQGAEDPRAKKRAQLREVMALAERHYVAQLWDPARGQEGRAYLEQRGVSEELAKRFGLGWANSAWTEIADLATREGMLEWALETSLVLPRKEGEGTFDFFRHRLMIPIRSQDGRTLAFGGRVMGGDGPKYLNSRESLLYRKSEILYGLDQARDAVRRQKEAILVEGYFDCIGLHQAGVTHALALCSTALTAGHLALLKRLGAESVVLLLDGDAAGARAVERLAGALLAAGMRTRVAVLPPNEDPDEFARRQGREGVLSLIAGAKPLTEHLFTTLLPEGPGASFEDKLAALERLKPTAAQLEVGLTRSAFIGALARHFGLPASQLQLALQGKAPAPVQPVPKPQPAAPQRPPDPLEALFAACLLRAPELVAHDTAGLREELEHLGLRLILSQVIAGESPDEALQGAAEPVQRALSRAAHDLPEGDLTGYFQALSHRLQLLRIDAQLRQLTQAARVSVGANDLDEPTRAMLSRRSELLAMRNRLKAEGPAGTKRTTPSV